MKKSRGYISGLRAGQCTGPLRPIRLSEKRVCEKSQIDKKNKRRRA